MPTRQETAGFANREEMGCQASNIGVSERKMVSQSSLTRLLRKIDNYGTTERKSGSSRPRSVRTAVNISTVDDSNVSFAK